MKRCCVTTGRGEREGGYSHGNESEATLHYMTQRWKGYSAHTLEFQKYILHLQECCAVTHLVHVPYF